MVKSTSTFDVLHTTTLATDALDRALTPALRLEGVMNQSLAASRAMEEALRPLRTLDETIRRAADPFFGMSEATRKAMMDPLAGLSDAMRRATDPLSGMSETLRRAVDPWAGLSEAMRKAVMDPLAGVSEVLRRATDPLMGISDALRNAAIGLDAAKLGPDRALAGLRIQNEMLAAAIARPTLKALSLSNVLENWSDPFGANFQAMALASRTLSEAIKAREQFRLKNAVTSVGTHSLLLDSLAVIEEETAAGFAPDTVKKLFPRLLALFIARLDRATSIFEQQRLMGVIAVLSFLLMFYFEDQGDAQHQETMDVLALIPAQTQPIEHLREDWEKYANEGERALAVVMRPANLRPAPDTKGRRLAVLRESEVVEFLELSNGWAKVRYFDAVADVMLEGWVYARLIRVVPRN